MNTIIVFSAIIAAAMAGEQLGAVNVVQDTVGNYDLKYNFAGASRVEQGFQGGKVIGGYTFVDKYGVSHPIEFESGPNGFLAKGEVPVPVQDTQAVSDVRAAHLAESQRLRSILPPLVEDPVVDYISTPEFRTFPRTFPVLTPIRRIVVDNSAEIAAAKAQHFAAQQEALARLAEAYRKLN